MAVYYKFKSAKDYDSISMDGHFISVANLKEKIFETKHLGRGTDFDLVVTNAQTNEEYLDEAMLIPKNTSVLIRRVPGRPRMRIVTEPVIDQDEPEPENKSVDVQPAKTSFFGADSVSKYPEDSEWDEFGNDLYAIPEVIPVQSNNHVQEPPLPNKADEDSKIRALIDTPTLDWQSQNSDGFGPGRGFGRGMGGRMGGRGFGRAGFERKTPPPGYICYRCKIPGHFIQHCPTNGDPTYDIKRVKPPTGIPKSMLMATPDGSYALPSGAVAVLKPNEAAFEKEIEGMPSTRPVGDFPPELLCPLCKEVIKDAVLTSKCCFQSFCDKCIRDYFISKSMCFCGATKILADDLLPNLTLRSTINRYLESNNNSAEIGGNVFQVQDMESARCPQPKIPSPTLSAASRREQIPPQTDDTTKIKETEQVQPQTDGTAIIQEMTEPAKAVSALPETLERTAKVVDVTEATHGSRSVKEPASQGSAPLADEEVQQKLVSGEAGKKKKKKKARLPFSATDMQWRTPQDFQAENYMMPMGPSAYNPYWTGMQPGMESFLGPYTAAPMPYMGYGLGPLDVPYGGILPHDPFGAQGFMLPYPPQRDLMGCGMGFNGGPPIMSREEFEARKADLKRKRDLERCGGREFSKERDFSREVSSGDVSSMKSKSKPNPPQPPPQPGTDHHHNLHRPRSERPSPDRHARDPEPTRPSAKRKSEYEDNHHHHQERERRHHRSAAKPPMAPPPLDPPPKSSAATISDRKSSSSKASVFSRISFPEEELESKKRKQGSGSISSSEPPAIPVGGSGSAAGSSMGHHHSHSHRKVSKKDVDYESSDDDRHFKRRPTRYESSPPLTLAEEAKHSSRGSRERERERGGYSSKRR